MAGCGVNDAFVRQELHMDTPIVRVGLWVDEQWLEEVSMLNGRGFDSAILRATQRAMYFPDVEWKMLEKKDLTEGMVCSGMRIVVEDPDGKTHFADYAFREGMVCRGVAVAMAFVAILRQYYTEREIAPNPPCSTIKL